MNTGMDKRLALDIIKFADTLREQAAELETTNRNAIDIDPRKRTERHAQASHRRRVSRHLYDMVPEDVYLQVRSDMANGTAG